MCAVCVCTPIPCMHSVPRKLRQQSGASVYHARIHTYLRRITHTNQHPPTNPPTRSRVSVALLSTPAAAFAPTAGGTSCLPSWYSDSRLRRTVLLPRKHAAVQTIVATTNSEPPLSMPTVATPLAGFSFGMYACGRISFPHVCV